MQADTRKANEPYVDYDFFVVKCGDCEKESGVVLYKEFGAYEGDEQLAYIKESTGYEVNHEEGGLRCKMCDRKNRVLRSKENERMV